MTDFPLSQVRDRHEMIRLFDGYAESRREEIEERRLKRPLVKSQLLEILNSEEAHSPEGLQTIFSRRGAHLRPIDDNLFLVRNGGGEIGVLERLRPRIVAIYSPLKSEELQKWIKNLVLPCPELDYVWLSGLTFEVLWSLIVRLSKPHRHTRMVFTHESIFDIDGLGASEGDDEEDDIASSKDEDSEREIVDRRATRFALADRIGVIQQKLHSLQELYSPFHAISQLRFPSPVCRGGHDFYDNGRVTNRSESFRDHRSHLLFVVRIYEQLLKATEDEAWYSIKESVSVPGNYRKIVGAPVVIRFREPLTSEVFNHWVNATFERKRNRFRLWGHPIRLGPTKVHVYGVDRHLWQPLFLELTSRWCTAIVPNGTCGNTVHRLVTNIQRYLDPGAEAFIGDKPFKTIVEESARGVTYDPTSE